MRIAPLIAASLLILCGCSGREHVRLELLVESLAKTWPRANLHLELKLRATEINGKVILHCVLKNTSPAALILNRSRLPWTSPAWLSVNAVAANGDVPPRPPPPAEISVLEAAPSQIVMNPGDILEGDVDLATGPIPRSANCLGTRIFSCCGRTRWTSVLQAKIHSLVALRFSNGDRECVAEGWPMWAANICVV